MRFRLLFFCFFLTISSEFVFAQQAKEHLIPSIKELIFPAQPEIKNNFNLFYEIHLSRDHIPQPSFWYKIIFSKDCDFEFTLFPLVEEDHYDFFLYKVAGNLLFCDAIEEKGVISLNHYKYQKEYEDKDQSERFRAGIINVKAIPVKAGDAIYLEVIATKGNDCGHIFDCRTSESSLVTKVFNDNCEAIVPIQVDSSLAIAERKEEVALHRLSDVFCLQRKKPIAFTSIQLSGESRTVKQQDDFLNYSKKESVNYEAYQKIDSSLISVDTNDSDSPIVTLPEKETPSFSDSILERRAQAIDTTQAIEKVKSTADLNRLTKASPHHTSYTAKGKRKVTRLEVDKALFSLLLEDLQIKKDLQKEAIRLQYSQFRKISKKNVSKRKQASQELKQLKEEKKKIEAKIANTQTKIKSIERLLVKQDDTSQENFVFNKSIGSENEELVYKIQIGVYKNKISPEIFKGLSPVSEDPYEGGVRYSVGAFPKLEYAQQAKAHVVEIGLEDAFIVSYFNGKRIKIQDAIKLER